jgi:hypothetical protein
VKYGHIRQVDSAGQVITLFTQFRPDYFFLIFYEAKARIFFQLCLARLFILYTKTARPPSPSAELIDCPQNKPGINEPSYEMVGVKITNKLIKSE